MPPFPIAFLLLDLLRLGPSHAQDAEEFLTSLLAALAGELTQPTSAVPVLSPAPVGAPANVLDTLMGLELDVECACLHLRNTAVWDAPPSPSAHCAFLLRSDVHGTRRRRGGVTPA